MTKPKKITIKPGKQFFNTKKIPFPLESEIKKYDVIVVGAGPAGSSAAYFMAKQGLNVVLLERGPYPGAKNCGGSSIIAEHTHKLFPNFWDEVECERLITDHAYWWLTDDSVLSVRFRSTKLAAAPYNRFSIKRSSLYKWLANKAVNAGATLLLDHYVNEVLFDECQSQAQAVGVQISPPQKYCFWADIIVLADGVNSLLAERSGLIPRISPQDTSLYVKESIALPSKVIEERFNLPPGNGSIIRLIGYPTAGFNGTASLHIFRESINLSVGMSLACLAQAGLSPNDLLERIKKHPHMYPLLTGGVTLEYGGAMIPEGGYNAIPQLVHPGLLIVGDAASLVNGTHGFNLAMWSGYFAAQAAYAAKVSGDYSVKKLYLYKTLLDESFIMQDLKANAGTARLMQDIPYAFDLYTRIANETAYQVAKVPTMPKRAKRVLIFKKVTSMQPLLKICKDVWKTLKVIR
ncbi:MAG TPA: FAD-dependent oxidoreductase [Methylomusa anaerophila]|uniref:Electron transfer flavoprotein-ubiquinone oxidoreductase n=1 Tax=Methylomusa anaerophila TaxID=1930071 RepID=A0A348APQ6_9FIRM|nr:FAD-dependent oxidoreductase [Methylomusa anaerophila]BBB93054.1 electron transfer flavoprotein-ubiquinone oxidoreductase [Methylomusa anaerophila]HML87113.1 FAD-dependent oxidoreductase [Methylomusa anaerophila]